MTHLCTNSLSTHLRLQIICCYFRRGYHESGFSFKLFLYSTIKEECHMGILFSFWQKKNQSGSQLLGRVVNKSEYLTLENIRSRFLSLKLLLRNIFCWCLRTKFCLSVLLCSKTICLPVSAQFLSNFDIIWENSLNTVPLWNQDYQRV